MVIKEALLLAEDKLRSCKIESYHLDAQILLAFVLQKDRVFLIAHNETPLDMEQEKFFFELVHKREKFMPAAYLIQQKEFMSLDFTVNEHVLIPRADTEILVEEILKRIQNSKDPHIIDIGTGSGAIAVSLCAYKKDCKMEAVDISKEALNVAEINEKRILGTLKIKFRKCDVLNDSQNFIEKFDVVVSNPPYIKTEDLKNLMPDVRDYEPMAALDGGVDGIIFYKKIVEKFTHQLKKNGLMAFEIGYDIKEDAVLILKDSGNFSKIEVIKDLAGIDRVIIATKK